MVSPNRNASSIPLHKVLLQLPSKSLSFFFLSLSLSVILFHSLGSCSCSHIHIYVYFFLKKKKRKKLRVASSLQASFAFNIKQTNKSWWSSYTPSIKYAFTILLFLAEMVKGIASGLGSKLFLVKTFV